LDAAEGRARDQTEILNAQLSLRSAPYPCSSVFICGLDFFRRSTGDTPEKIKPQMDADEHG